MEDAIYKVLWVDDDPNIVEGYRLAAGKRNIILLHALHWADAQVILEKEFDELTAIILDANCKWDAKSSIYGDFLRDVLSQLNKRQGKADRYIPWYILSAGTGDGNTLADQATSSRIIRECLDSWGWRLWKKHDDVSPVRRTAVQAASCCVHIPASQRRREQREHL